MEAYEEAIESQTQQDIRPYTVAEDEMGSSVVVLVLRLNSCRIWWWVYR